MYFYRHVRGRVLCAVANCTVAIFRRDSDGQWDLSKYHVVDLGPPVQSIRCLIAVHNKVWCGYKNRIHVLDPASMAVQVCVFIIFECYFFFFAFLCINIDIESN